MSDAAYRLQRRATLAKEDGRPAAAKRDFEEAIGLPREAGRQRELGQAPRVLDEVERGRGDNESSTRAALLARRQGDRERARHWLSEAIAAAGSRGDPDARRHAREVRAEIEDWAAGGSK
jgi:tetratricopeptide (TPR) repeat protein